MKTHDQMNRDQRAIVDLLERKGKEGASTTEIVEAGFNGYRARLSELRHDFTPPIDVKCLYDGTTPEGRKKHRYYLPQYAPDAPLNVSDTPVSDAAIAEMHKDAGTENPIKEKPAEPFQESIPGAEKIEVKKSNYDRKVDAYQLAERNYTWNRSKENKQKLDIATGELEDAELEDAIKAERAKEAAEKAK